MEFKKLMSAAAIIAAVSFGATTASAKSEAKAVFDGLYPGNAVSCNVCHVGSPGALTAFGTMYMSKGGDKNGTASAIIAMETVDSDTDGVINILEYRALTNPLLADKAGITNTAGDVLVSGSSVSAVATTAATSADIYTAAGVTLSVGQVVLGGVGVQATLGTAGSITVSFKDAAYGTVKVYEANNTAVITPTVNASGSITFSTTTAPSNFYVESGVRPASSSTSSSSSGGCISSSATTPLMMFLAMLSLGFFVRRKKD